MTWADLHILHPSIVDDAGVRRTVDFANWAKVRDRADPPTRFAIGAVAKAIGPIGGPPGVITWTIMAVLVAAIVVKFIADVHRGAATVADALGGPAILFALIAWCWWCMPRWNLWRYGRSMVPILASRGVCPCCGYSIRELAPVDGMIRCPECGGRWRADRMRAEHGAERTREWLEMIGPVMSRRRGLRDDAGKQTYAIVRTPRRAAKEEADTAVRARQLDADRAIRRVSGSVRFAIVFGAVLVMLMGLMDSAPSPRMVFTWNGVLSFLSGYGVVIIFGALVVRSYIGLSAPAARAQILARGLCPTCVSDLAGIAPDAERLRPCAVCGSAWRVPSELPKCTD